MKFTHITIDPTQMGGVACIRGLRIPVATVVSALAEGMNDAQILAYYPALEAATLAWRCCMLQKPFRNANCLWSTPNEISD